MSAPFILDVAHTLSDEDVLPLGLETVDEKDGHYRRKPERDHAAYTVRKTVRGIETNGRLPDGRQPERDHAAYTVRKTVRGIETNGRLPDGRQPERDHAAYIPSAIRILPLGESGENSAEGAEEKRARDAKGV